MYITSSDCMYSKEWESYTSQSNITRCWEEEPRDPICAPAQSISCYGINVEHAFRFIALLLFGSNCFREFLIPSMPRY